MTRRIVGTLLILLGALGILLSASGVIGVWRAREDVVVAVDDSLTLLSNTLKDVDRSLDVASTTLDGAALAMDGLYTTTLDVTETLSSTRLTIHEMATLTEDDLPQSVEASLAALEALEETAASIDQLLRGLQRFGVGEYDPEVPLDQAVTDVGAGLEPVPGSLRVMGAGMRQTADSLKDVQGGLGMIGGHMMDIRGDIVDGEAAVSSYRSTLVRLDARVRALRRRVHRPIRAVAWAVTLLLIWIGLSQLAILRWGVRLWRQPQSHSEESAGTREPPR